MAHILQKYGDSDMLDDKDSAGSDMMVSPGVPVFQNLLLHFLDTKAPALGMYCTFVRSINADIYIKALPIETFVM